MSTIVKSLVDGKLIFSIGTVFCAVLLLLFALISRNKDYHNKAFEMVNNMIKSFSNKELENNSK